MIGLEIPISGCSTRLNLQRLNQSLTVISKLTVALFITNSSVTFAACIFYFQDEVLRHISINC